MNIDALHPLVVAVIFIGGVALFCFVSCVIVVLAASYHDYKRRKDRLWGYPLDPNPTLWRTITNNFRRGLNDLK